GEEVRRSNHRESRHSLPGLCLCLRVRFERKRREEGRLEPLGREGDELGPDLVALKELEAEATERDLEGYDAQQEAPARIRIVLCVEAVTSLEREVGRVDEILVEL